MVRLNNFFLFNFLDLRAQLQKLFLALFQTILVLLLVLPALNFLLLVLEKGLLVLLNLGFSFVKALLVLSKFEVLLSLVSLHRLNKFLILLLNILDT